tara:strand:- start:311 stop:1045 length:735 start_codon:yes stop_codon:yes gene_type:complete
MATFTITTSLKTNLPPSVIGNRYIKAVSSTNYVFTVEDFTTLLVPKYFDPEGDEMSKVKINAITFVSASLELLGTPLIVGDEVTSADIAAGNLILVDSGTIIHTETFDFTCSDVGSNSFSLDEGTYTFEYSAIQNSPPSSVGDNTLTIDYGETLVFTRAMFTVDTIPAYSDPEGDPAVTLKITSLPGSGHVIKNNGVTISINEEILFSDIDLGLLTYHGASESYVLEVENFSFEIADVSGIFVS